MNTFELDTVIIDTVSSEIFSLFGLFIILEASMPSAASLPIVVDLRNGNSAFVSKGVFLLIL